MSTGAAVVTVVCGAELVVAFIIGGVGLTALFGWESLVAAGALSGLVLGWRTQR